VYPASRHVPSPIAAEISPLVDALPAFNAVHAAGIGQALARLRADFIRVIGQQNIGSGEIGGVLIEDVLGEFPAQHLEAGQFGPAAIAREQGIGSDVERRRITELAAPQTDGVYVPAILIQHIGHHAQHVWKVTGRDLILEVADDDVFEVAAHFRDCFLPRNRNKAG
jgi:hypothetical protein